MSTIIMSKCWPLQMEKSQKFVLMSLADNANDDGVCWPSVETIVMRTCLSERTVRRVISQLVEAGWLISDERPGRSNVFTIITDNTPKTTEKESQLMQKHPKGMPPRQGCHDDRGATVSGEVCHHDRGGMPQCQGGYAMVSGRTVIDPSLNRNEPSFGAKPQKTHRTKESKKATSLPKDFKPNENHIALSDQLGVDLNTEFEKFCDYARANGKTYKDWPAALNNWIRNSTRFWTGNKQSAKNREITPATNEVPPGFLNSRPDYQAPVITQEDIDAAPY